MAKKYQRGFTAQAPAAPDKRPPKLGRGVFNPLTPLTRSALMSPPTGDTEEPRLSRDEPTRKKLSKGRRVTLAQALKNFSR